MINKIGHNNVALMYMYTGRSRFKKGGFSAIICSYFTQKFPTKRGVQMLATPSHPQLHVPKVMKYY